MTLEMHFPEQDGKPARVRRAVLGPVWHMTTSPPSFRVLAFSATPSETANPGAEHSFCPCCLFTRSMGAFKNHLDQDGFFGIRLFASQNEQGVVQADCRVNGEDWPAGANALRDYALTWDVAGYEFRKQYVIIQTMAPFATTPMDM